MAAGISFMMVRVKLSRFHDKIQILQIQRYPNQLRKLTDRLSSISAIVGFHLGQTSEIVWNNHKYHII